MKAAAECTDRNKEVRSRGVEQDELDRALDFLERSLGMSARYLMDPYSALSTSTGFGSYRHA